MNNQGQIVFYTFMVGVVIIVLALAFAPVLKTHIDDVRGNSTLSYTNKTIGLDCSNSSISNFDKATCVVTDLSLFQFIVGLLVLAGAVITARRFL